MTTLELVLNMLAEATTTELSKTTKPATFSENRQVAQTGGAIAGNTRREIEATTGKPVISPQNAAQLNRVVADMIEETAEIYENSAAKPVAIGDMTKEHDTGSDAYPGQID